MTEVGLFPRPRHLDVSGPGAAIDTPATETLDPRLPDQGFTLRVGDSRVELGFADAAGARYGRGALDQLRQGSDGSLPGLELRDWPDLPVRGYMLDVSRDRVPTRATLRQLVAHMAALRLNHLQLYTEHTFAYRDHADVWRDASPITPDDVRWLQGLCDDAGVELAANQNVFGHMGRWLAHDAYRDRAEAPEGWDTPWGGRGQPGVLEPTEANAAFVIELLRELIPNFDSRRVNINCDETFELGQGRSRAAVEARGRGRVYLDFVRRVIDALLAEDREVLFWGDVVRQHPELVPEIPRKDCTGLAWHYEAPIEGELDLPPAALEVMAGLGMDEASLRGFAAHTEPFAAVDFPFWVCPGTSTWNTTTGRLPNALGNLLDAAQNGREYGARGYLITDWGDNGHMAPPGVSLPPLAYGAGLAWCLDTNRDVDLADVLNRHVFRDASGRLGPALVELGRAYAVPGVRVSNASPLQTALLGRNLGPLAGGQTSAAALDACVGLLDDCVREIERATPSCVGSELLAPELVQAAHMARHGAWRLARSGHLPAPDDAALARDLDGLIEAQRATWLARSRPGGLSDSIARLERRRRDYA